MARPIEVLMDEHRLIEKVLTSLERFAGDMTEGADGDRQTVAGYAEFFREFADRCHHGKEEDILFKALANNGMPTEAGPIRVMLHEHDLGRASVRELASVRDGQGALTGDELEKVRGAAASFVPLLRAHIQKEDGILFPMAVRLLPAGVLEEIDNKFQAFDREEIGEGTQQRLRSLAESLIG